MARDLKRVGGMVGDGSGGARIRADIEADVPTSFTLTGFSLVVRLTLDLPAGGKRLLETAAGYLASLVNGAMTLRRDRLAGARPGRVVRVGG